MSMGMRVHSPKPRPPRISSIVIAVSGLICGDALLVSGRARVVGAAVVLVSLVPVGLASRRFLLTATGGTRLLMRLRDATGLLLYLSPIVMLSIAYPIASRRLTGAAIGGVRFTTLLLGVSVTVPWLTQAVCLPLFRAVAPHVAAEEPDKILGRLCETWPVTFGQCLPVVLVFAVPIKWSMHWSPAAIGAYIGLTTLYVAFAQSLIPSIALRQRGRWAIGWAAVAAALVLFPFAWFLPPLVGLATQLLFMRRHWARLTRPARLAVGDVVVDVGRGLLLGSVLWSDKYFFFLRAGDQFAVRSIYVALLPAVLAYNYYFVRLAPRFDASIVDLRRAMESASYAVLIRRSRTVYRTVTRSLSRSALVGAALAVVVILVVAVADWMSLPLVVAVTASSWLAMMLTLLCYKLDYIGQIRTAQVLSGCYLVGCGMAFALLPLGTATFVGLIGVDALLVTLALRAALEHWRSPEYSLFWRHATAW